MKPVFSKKTERMTRKTGHMSMRSKLYDELGEGQRTKGADEDQRDKTDYFRNPSTLSC